MPVKIIKRIVFVCLLGFTSLSSAEAIRDYYAEPGINPFKDALNQNFNEQLDPFSGSVSHSYIDLKIPGNGGLDIVVNRVYNSVQDSVGTRNVNGTGWTMHFGRIVVASGDADKICAQNLWSVSVTNNPSLERADGGREILFLANDPNAYLITRSRWKAECGVSGMVVTGPDGTVYTMDQYEDNGTEVSWYTSRIEDTNGNRIDIAYKTGGGFTYIDTVTASDGRLVQYNYDFDGTATVRLRSITANTQTWQYRYSAIPELGGGQEQLTEVVRPDNKSWKYDYYPLLGTAGLAGSFSLQKVTYPYGGTIDYTYKYVYFNPADTTFPTTAIDRKTIGGTNISPGTWTYSYEPAINRGSALDKTTITAPNGRYEYQHFGYSGNFSGDVWKIGLLFSRETYDQAGILIEQEVNDWGSQAISGENYWHGRSTAKVDSGTVAPILLSREIWREGGVYRTKYSGYDSYGNPAQVVETGNVIGDDTRTTDYTYYTDTTRWIIGQTKDETIPGIGTIARTFDSAGNLLTEDKYGVLTTYTYLPSGDVSTITDARNKTTTYLDYFRGIARQEDRPQAVTINRIVNPAGTLASETNGRGYTTGFTYDGLNRITSIDFPTNADVSINWTSNSKVLTRGAYSEETVLDGFSRSIQVDRRDSVLSNSIVTTSQYDALGNKVFESYPNSAQGTTFSYDVIGRVTRVDHPDGAFRTIVYLDPAGSGIETETNERGFVTKRLYRAFGHPDKRDLVRIDSPENVQTLISRNLIGQIDTVWQGEVNNSGYQRDYSYDTRRFLVSRTDPEIGATVFGRDAVGNMTSRTVGALAQTNYVYDDLNRLTNIDYPGSTPDVTFAYDANDNVERVDNGVAERMYSYDENDNLASETLNIDGLSLTLQYAYSALDFIGSITYPSARVVGFSPDAFGRPHTVGAFISSVSYHPTGVPDSITLANGTQTITALHPTRLWPDNVSISRGATPLVGLDYGYDSAGNVATITDQLTASNNKVLGYDGLDRLQSASGPWGSGSIGYDHRGNISSKTIGSTSLVYNYNQQRLIETIRNGQSDGAIAYDGYGNVAFSGNPFDTLRPVREFTFNDASNLTQARLNSSVVRWFVYDGNDTLVKVTAADGVSTYKLYADSGDLIGEYDSGGNVTKEYAYLGSKLVAMVEVVPPLADAGSDQAVFEGTAVTLNASSSSAYDGSIATYNWVQTAGPVVVLNNASSATPDFIAPSVSGDAGLVFQVTVTDDTGLSASATVDIIVWDSVPPPIVEDIQARQGMGENRINWTPVPQASSYNLYWSTTPGVIPGAGNAITGLTSPEFIHSGLTDSQDYYYVIVGVNQFGEGTSFREIRLTPGTNGWGSAHQIPAPPGITSQHARIARDASGGAIAVWMQTPTGASNASVYASQYDPAAGWGAATVIANEDYSGTPTIAMNQLTGQAVVVIDSYSNVFGVAYSPDIGWTQPYALSSATGIRIADAPVVAVNTTGKASVLWREDMPDNGFNTRYIRAASYDFSSHLWQASQSIVADLGPAEIGIDDAGNALAVWMRSSTLRSARFDVQTGTWVFLSLPLVGTVQEFDLSMNGNGQAVLVWDEAYSGSDRLRSAYFNSTSWNQTSRVLATGSVLHPAISIDNEGDTTAAWLFDTMPGWEVRAARSSLGGVWSPIQTIGAMGNMADAELELAGNSAGDVLVGWTASEQSSTQAYTVWANHYTELAGWEGASFIYNRDQAAGAIQAASGLSVALSNNGDGSVSWSVNGGEENQLRIAHYYWLGSQYGTPNHAPLANAGPSPTGVGSGNSGILDGSRSYDQEAGPLTYAWTQISGAPVNLVGADTATPELIPHTIEGIFTGNVFRLTVTDAAGLSGSDEVTVTINNPPPAPPGNIVGAPGNTESVLYWDPVWNATSYNLYWSTSPGVTPANGNLIAGVTPGYRHAGRTNGVTYYYVLTTVGTNGETVASSEVTIIPGVATWGSETLYATNVGQYSEPKVAIDSSGNMLLAWLDQDGLFRLNRFDAAAGWGEEILLSSQATTTATFIATALSDNGAGLVAWQEYDGTTISVTARYYQPGSGWGPAQVLWTSPPGGYYSNTEVRAAMDSQGNGMVAWLNSQTGVYARPYSGTGGWGPVELVPAAPGGALALAMAPDGTATLAWSNSTASENQVRAKRYQSGVWSADTLLAATGDPQAGISGSGGTGFQLASNNGAAVAVWTQDEVIIPGTPDDPVLETRIMASTYAAGTWTTTTLLSPPDNSAYYASVVMDSSGNATVVGQQNGDIWSRRFEGGAWGGSVPAEAETTGFYYRTGLGVDAQGIVTAVWDTASQLWTNRYTPGSGWGAATPIGTSRLPQTLVMSGSGQAVVTGFRNNSPQDDLMYQRYWAIPAGPPANTAPIANAGSDQSVSEGSLITLDGSASTDAEGPLTYSWSQTGGPALTLANADTAAPSFTAPNVTADTPLNFDLTVTDSGSLTAIDSVTVNVQMLDTDSDGMSDLWEQSNFGSMAMTATGDADGDGIANLDEFLQQLNPLDGDINGDSALTVADLLLLQRHVLGISLMTPARQLAADVAPWGSPDGALNAGDLVVLQRRLMSVQ